MINGLLTQSDVFGLIFMAVALVIFLIWRARQSNNKGNRLGAATRTPIPNFPTFDQNLYLQFSPPSESFRLFFPPLAPRQGTRPLRQNPNSLSAAQTDSLQTEQPNRNKPPATLIAAMQAAKRLAEDNQIAKPPANTTCPITQETPEIPIYIVINTDITMIYDLDNLLASIVTHKLNKLPGVYEAPLPENTKATASFKDGKLAIEINFELTAEPTATQAASASG